MVRTEGRHREFAVRRAVGAARAQLIRLQMAEALVVAGLAGVLAMGLAAAGLAVFLRAAPEGIPRIDHVGVNLTLLLHARRGRGVGGGVRSDSSHSRVFAKPGATA